MTFITITTIGFSELTNLSAAGCVFIIIIFVMGIGVISYIATQTTQLIFGSELFRVKVMKAQLQKMNNHYIIAGNRRIGHRIARVLKEVDISLVTIKKNDRKVEDIKDDQLLYVSGDAQKVDVLGDVNDIKKLRREGCDDDRSISDRVSTYNFLNIINSQTTNNPDIV